METTEKEKLKMPPRKLTVKIGGNDYEISLPNNGQRIDIQSNKLKVTGSKHSDMLYGDTDAMEAYMLTSAITTFSILAPKLLEDITAPLHELDFYNPITRDLLKAYEAYYDWDKSWKMFINQQVDEKK